MLIVQKFGGTSLADPQRLHTAARRAIQAKQSGAQVIVVVSAQGHTTDELARAAGAVTDAPACREMDVLLSAGEQMSAALMAMAIDAQGEKAISLTGWQAGLLTDRVHTNAQLQALTGDRLRQALDDGAIAVVAGFQGISPEGNVTTLGRGGSDTTAVALAAFLEADACQIYTDVDGVYDKDPRHHPDALRFDRIGYKQMLDLIDAGAQVLHDRSVLLARQYRIPIRVLSSFRPGPGTLVGPQD